MPTSESYKSFVNLNGVSVEDRLGDYVKKTVNITDSRQSTVDDIRGCVRILRAAHIISDEAANDLTDQIDRVS